MPHQGKQAGDAEARDLHTTATGGLAVQVRHIWQHTGGTQLDTKHSDLAAFTQKHGPAW